MNGHTLGLCLSIQLKLKKKLYHPRFHSGSQRGYVKISETLLSVRHDDGMCTSNFPTSQFYFSFQTSVDDVVMLVKQHDNFEKTLTAQEEKLHSLSDMASGLVRTGHRDSQW